MQRSGIQESLLSRNSHFPFIFCALHLIINDKGEILSFYLSKGNVDDRNAKAITTMTKEIFGKLFGDKGYISKALSDLLFSDGIVDYRCSQKYEV